MKTTRKYFYFQNAWKLYFLQKYFNTLLGKSFSFNLSADSYVLIIIIAKKLN